MSDSAVVIPDGADRNRFCMPLEVILSKLTTWTMGALGGNQRAKQ
jgi:hypothetical protein